MADDNSEGGMKVAIPQQSPFGSGDIPELDQSEKKRGPNISHIIAPVIIIAVLIVLVYALVISKGPSTTSVSTTINTTSTATQSGYLSSCSNLTAPGTYSLSGDIKTSNINGPCMDIKSSNVMLDCAGHSIIGSGPYTGIPPFSYGIRVTGVSNVSILNCSVGNFSYGVYSEGALGLRLLYNNMSTNYVANLYLGNSSGGTIERNIFMHSGSPYGAVIIATGSLNNLFQNNSLRYNEFYGFNVSATANRFIDNYIVGSQFSFECRAQDGLPSSSLAQGNTCFNQTGCDFVTCRGLNVPVNVSQISLSTPISSCGSINSPGSYSLTSNLNMKDYSGAAIATLSYYKIPCLKITADNVALNCNGHTISNAYAGIEAVADNITLRNCNANSSDIGILFNKVSSGSIENSTLADNNASVSLTGSLGITMSNIHETNSTYGLYFFDSSADILGNFTANYNRFGVYVTNSFGNIFNNGVAINNTMFDVFATPDSYNATDNLMGSTNCGLTDAAWAPCAQHTSTTYFAYPLTACTDIKHPGVYTLTQNIINAQINCMKIESSDVSLNCSSFSIDAQPLTQGAGIVISNRRNVSISNCKLLNYNTALQAANVSGFLFNNISGQTIDAYGIVMSNSRNGTISNTNIPTPKNMTISLVGVRNVTVFNNTMDAIGNGGSALLLENSVNNRIFNNSGYANKYGIQIIGASNNNTVENNSMTSSTAADYYCDAQDSGMVSENGGINTGSKKIGCHWMAALPLSSKPIYCSAYNTPENDYLTQDYIYSYGAICQKYFGNDSALNCEGHTVIATNGGTIAQFADSHGGMLENCYLKGFTTPVLVTGGSATVLNNTMYENTSQYYASAPAINVTNSIFGGTVIKLNNIITPGKGIYLDQVISGKVLDNNVTAGGVAYSVSLSNTTVFTNDTATGLSGEGFALYDSISNQFAYNHLYGLTAGILCSGTAKNSTNNFDGGHNYCSLNSNCEWISSSSSTC